jgi:23S rRNA pseudouridine2605 synthase
LTAEQLEASRSERMRQNGIGATTLEDARTWLEETGLCLFLPRRQFSSFIAPSFVEAVAGERNQTPAAKTVALAEDLLIRLETDGVAVRLNLLGQPDEQPDFVVAAWVLPYVYALRGDRDWRRSPQLTGSRQVSPLAIQAYKLLEAGDATIPQLKHALGREVTESAVLRAITELWQQLRIIPVVSAPGKAAQWQLLRLRFQKAIAEGASTSQVTAISVLASIYLQAVIAASMEEVELFLAPLTARSKVREVLRGLVATRQVHTISFGHAPQFYVAGTLPEFTPPPTAYSSSAMPASTYFLHSYEHEDEVHEPAIPSSTAATAPIPAGVRKPASAAAEPAPRIAAEPPAPAGGKPPTASHHFSRQPARSRDRKPSQSSASSRVAWPTGRDGRATSARPAGARLNGSSRHAQVARWAHGTAKSANGKHNGTHAGKASTSGGRFNGNGHARTARPVNGASSLRNTKPNAASSLRNGHATAGKAAAKPASRRASTSRASLSRPSLSRKEARPEVRSARGSRKPALSAAAKVGNRTRYGFTASSRQRTKKRG